MRKTRFIIGLWTLLLAGLFSVAGMEGKAAAVTESELVEAAKKESGKLLGSIAMRLETAKKLTDGFRAKYPFVREVSQYRADAERRLERTLSEFRAGRHSFDVFQGSPPDIAILKGEGVLAPFDAPQRKSIDSRFKDDEGYWTDVYWYPVIIAYNTSLVSGADVPKTWQDLLNPKWKGKITMPRDQIGWHRVMVKSLGEEAATRFMQDLAKQDVRISRGVSDGVTLLAAGEFHVAVTRAQHIEIFKAKGAPVDWVKNLNPMAVHGSPIALMKHAPAPNTAKLFLNYLFSEDAAEIIAESRRLPARSDVKGLSPGYKQMSRDNLVRTPDEDIFKNYQKYRAQFREWFGGPK